MQKKQIRIMLFGTFDFLHAGHLHFFKQARALAENPYVIVSIARDVNVKKIKGKKPLFSEKQRAAAVKKSAYVDKVVLGGIRDYLVHILKEKPHIIALGYDQSHYTKGLKKLLQQNGLKKVIIRRLKPYKPHVYKSSLLKVGIKGLL